MCHEYKLAHLSWCSQLLNSYSASMVNFIWFTYDKLLKFYHCSHKITKNNRFHALVGID